MVEFTDTIRLYPHTLRQNDDISTIQKTDNLRQPIPGDVILRLMDDGSFKIELINKFEEPVTIIGLDKQKQDIINRLTSSGGNVISGLTEEERQIIEDQIAAMGNLNVIINDQQSQINAITELLVTDPDTDTPVAIRKGVVQW